MVVKIGGFMRHFFLLCVLILASTHVVHGADKFTVKAMTISSIDIFSICQDSYLILNIKKLKKYTESKMETVSSYMNNKGACEFSKKYFENLEPNNAQIKILPFRQEDKIWEKCDRNTCKALFNVTTAERVTLTIDDVEFHAEKAILSTKYEVLKEWSTDSCPPYAPDCDL